MGTDEQFVEALALAVAARLQEVVPPGYSVWATGVSVMVLSDGQNEVFAGRTDFDWMFEGQDRASGIIASIERTLDDVQDWVREDSTEQWPPAVDGAAWVTLTDGVARMGYGSLELRPIAIIELR